MKDGLCCKVSSKAVIHRIPTTEKVFSRFTADAINSKSIRNAKIEPKLEHTQNSTTDSISIIPFCI